MSLNRVLIIDDDEDLSAYMQAVANNMGYDTRICNDPARLNDVYRDDIATVILDIMMPNLDGVEVLRLLADKRCQAGIIIVSGSDQKILVATEKIAIDRKLNFVGSLQKPFVPENLTALLTKSRLSQNSRRLQRHPLEGLNIKMPSSDELVVMFQPKINMQTLDFSSVEALVRWQHPTKGLLAPGFFIPAAESSGHIDKLTDAIVHKTLAQCNRWMQDDLIVDIAINISARTLGDLSLPDRLEEMLRSYCVNPSQITLEVTETWLSSNPVDCLDSLTRLSLKGFKISIDDFGTGYSSITQLSRIPFSELKIDQSFVKHAPLNVQARKILQSSVELGHHLDMNVVAEGVETQEQWDLVREAKCNECQGFFIARPLPAGSTPAWLSRWQSMQRSSEPKLRKTGKLAPSEFSDVKM
ncbi:MAG: EAL domain-containing protein [Gammaproteobacteria bacterium]